MNVNWPQIAGRVRADLDRAKLNERPRLVMAVLLKLTLIKRRLSVVLPDRIQLCRVIGIDKGHMAGVWSELQDARIADFKAVAGGWQCVVFPDSNGWQVGWVYSRAEWDRYAEFVERTPGQAQSELFEPEPNLTKAVAEVGAITVGSYQKGNSAVTKKVTDAPPPVPPHLKGSKLKAFNLEPSSELEMMDRCRTILGNSAMETYGGNWRLRARQDMDKLQRVLAETECADREGRIRTSPAAYANDLWGRFA